MADKFEKGEVAIYVRPGSRNYGQEVTVKSDLIFSPGGVDSMTGESVEPCMVYEIDAEAPEGYRRVAKPEWLRKKKPPRREIDQIVSWEDCLWKPQAVTQ